VGQRRGVRLYHVVRKDAPAAEYRPAMVGLVGKRVRNALAVLVEVIGRLVDRGEFLLVVILPLAPLVGRLDEAARRRVVAAHGHLQHALVAEVELLLNQPLAERAPAHKEGPVVVL